MIKTIRWRILLKIEISNFMSGQWTLVVQSKNGGAEKWKYLITMLYNRFDYSTSVDFGAKDNGGKIFALRPLGDGIFDKNYFFLWNR